jgi:hypothetical protein
MIKDELKTLKERSFNKAKIKEKALEIFPELDFLINKTKVFFYGGYTIFTNEELNTVFLPDYLLLEEMSAVCFFLREVLKINANALVDDPYFSIRVNHKYNVLVIKRLYELGLYPPRIFLVLAKYIEDALKALQEGGDE